MGLSTPMRRRAPAEAMPAVARKSTWDIRNILPIFVWLPAYDWRRQLAGDVGGGVTVGAVLLAQSIAHAQLSGVALVHGPYSCVLAPVVYMLFGTSKQGSVGTGGLIALLTGTTLARFEDEAERTQAAALLALLVGTVLVLMGALQLAGLVRFLSRPALSGFVTGSALLIIASQVPGCLGLPSQRLSSLALAVFSGEQRPNIATVVLSLLALLALVAMQRLKGIRPGLTTLTEFKELIVLAICTLICAFWGAAYDIALVGELHTGPPKPSLPVISRDLVAQLLPGAFLLAMIVFISSFAAAKKIAMAESYQIDATNELLGLGFANVACAFIGGLPVQIGLSRTSIAYASGVKSQLGLGLVVSCVVTLSLIVLTPLFHYMPKCALNCVIIAAAKSLIDFKEPVWLYRLPINRRDFKDLGVWATAFLVTLAWGACQGMCCAVGLSLVLLVLEVTEPNLAILGGERFQSMQDMSEQPPELVVARLDGALFFANAERFQEQIESIVAAREAAGVHTRFVILDFSCVPFVDATVVQVLRDLGGALKLRGVTVRVANALARPRSVLSKELADCFGQSNFRMSVMEVYHELFRKPYVPPGSV